jgi:hypothetical protein
MYRKRYPEKLEIFCHFFTISLLCFTHFCENCTSLNGLPYHSHSSSLSCDFSWSSASGSVRVPSLDSRSLGEKFSDMKDDVCLHQTLAAKCMLLFVGHLNILGRKSALSITEDSFQGPCSGHLLWRCDVRPFHALLLCIKVRVVEPAFIASHSFWWEVIPLVANSSRSCTAMPVCPFVL